LKQVDSWAFNPKVNVLHQGSGFPTIKGTTAIQIINFHHNNGGKRERIVVPIMRDVTTCSSIYFTSEVTIAEATVETLHPAGKIL
jgi:hypothetical protein